MSVWTQHEIFADNVALKQVLSATDAENENVAKPQARGKANMSNPNIKCVSVCVS